MTSPQEGHYPGPNARAQHPHDQRPGGRPPPPPPPAGYSPYGGPRPSRGPSASFTPQSAQRTGRPSLLLVAVGLLVLGALPWLLLGTAFTFLPLNVQGMIDNGSLAGSSLADYSAEDIVTAVRAAAVVAAVCSVVYLVLVGLTYGRRRWARILVTVLTAIFAAGLVLVLVTTLSPIVALLVAAPVAGAVLLFTRPVSAWFAG